MFKRIKEYFEMRKLERQMKYALLSHLYLFVDEKNSYIKFFRSLATEIDYESFQSDLISKIAEFAHAEAQKQRELEQKNEEVNTEE